MRSRLVAVLPVAVALLLASPSGLRADKPRFQTYWGVLGFVSNCPEADDALLAWCTREPYLYVVKVKGAKRLEGRRVLIEGPQVITSCGLPGVEVKRVTEDDSPPPDCP